MSKWKFEVKDFSDCYGPSAVVDVANAKLKERIGSAPVVYGTVERDSKTFEYTLIHDFQSYIRPGKTDTHTARLIMIEEIKRESAEDVLRDFVRWTKNGGFIEYKQWAR